MKRTEKIALLTKLVQGKASEYDLKRFRDQQRNAWFVVVTDGRNPQPTDQVEVWPRDRSGIKTVSYAEFSSNPNYYGSTCIVLDI